MDRRTPDRSAPVGHFYGFEKSSTRAPSGDWVFLTWLLWYQHLTLQVYRTFSQTLCMDFHRRDFLYNLQT